MNKALEMLAELAVKLGTTMEYLWPCLVGRERLSGACGFTIAVAGIVIALLVARRLHRLTLRAYERDDGAWWKTDACGQLIFIWICAALLTGLFLLGVWEELLNLAYPEVAALETLAKLLGQ